MTVVPEFRPSASEALKSTWLNIAPDVKITFEQANHYFLNLIKFHKSSLIKAAAFTYIGS
jgi:hypothetical protein